MKALPSLLFVLIYCTGVFAQKATAVTVKADNNIMDVLSTKDVFHYPEFTNGKVFFNNSTVTQATLNYNRLFDEMHFISSKGDTLAVTNENTIKYIVIGKDSFFYDHGYIRLISAVNTIKLAVKQIWRISDIRKIGAFNAPNSSATITSYTSISDARRLYDLVVNEDLVLSKVEQYYLGDNYNHFLPANKKNLLVLFPKEKKRIEMYLKENRVDFNKKDDIDKIVRFLDHL